MNIKQPLITLGSALGAFAIVTTATFAIGTLTPSGTPGSNTQYTLNDIYTRLTTNTTTTQGSGLFATPSGVPTESFRTLTEIYNMIPTIDPSKVALGTTYLGVAGTLSVPDPVPELEWSIAQAGPTTWLISKSNCDNLSENGGNWRLPTIEDFANITDFTRVNNATLVAGFVQNTWYWADTQLADAVDSTKAWYWSSYDGSMGTDLKTLSTENLFRCIREVGSGGDVEEGGGGGDPVIQ